MTVSIKVEWSGDPTEETRAMAIAATVASVLPAGLVPTGIDTQVVQGWAATP